jgi:hypothetical protein
MDTFYGLETPTEYDWNEHNQLSYPKGYAIGSIQSVKQNIQRICGNNASYELYEGKLQTVLPNIPLRKYSFALIDLLQFMPTEIAIDYIIDKISENGMIYFLNYNNRNDLSSATRAINNFIHNDTYNINVLPDIVINGNTMPICRVIINTTVNKINKPPLTNNTDKLTKIIPKNTNSVTVRPNSSPNNETKEIIKPHNHYNKINNSTKINIALVLKNGGGTYDYRYINAIAKNVREKVTIPYNLVVLTDDDNGFDQTVINEVIPLKHNFSGWWSKIELFRPNIFSGQVFYMDLDTVIVDNIDDIISVNTIFSGIRDLYHHNFMNTGLMSWDSRYNEQIYENFVKQSYSIMKTYTEGDAKWIRNNVYNYDYLTDFFPNKIVSFKASCYNKITGNISIPLNASIICFHGLPRPHTITHPSITKHWKH